MCSGAFTPSCSKGRTVVFEVTYPARGWSVKSPQCSHLHEKDWCPRPPSNQRACGTSTTAALVGDLSHKPQVTHLSHNNKLSKGFCEQAKNSTVAVIFARPPPPPHSPGVLVSHTHQRIHNVLYRRIYRKDPHTSRIGRVYGCNCSVGCCWAGTICWRGGHHLVVVEIVTICWESVGGY